MDTAEQPRDLNLDPGLDPGVDPGVDHALRRRLVGTLFVGATLTSTGYIAAVTVAPIVATEVLDLGPLLGLPGAVSILGTAAGSTVIAALMAKRGRRPGLLVGFATSAIGAVIAVLGVATANAIVFTVGLTAMGFGNAANHQARYAAADLYPPERRSSVIGTVVWAATIGAVAGPALVAPTGRLAVQFGRSELSGGLAAGAVGFTLAWLLTAVVLRPDPADLALPDAVPDLVLDAVPIDLPSEDGRFAPVRARRVPPHATVALTTMVAGHFVMVLIMSVTAIRLRHGGSGLAAVSVVLSVHILGMFAFTPLLGRLADRIGALRVIVYGLGTLTFAALLAAASPADAPWLLTVALLLLGVGWSAGFVAGSGLLSSGGTSAERARLQGRADTYVFATAATASLGAGALLDTAGYTVLCLLGAAITIVVLVMVWRGRRSLIAPAVRA